MQWNKRPFLLRISPSVFALLLTVLMLVTQGQAIVFANESDSATVKEKPNVLIIMADDCTHNDLPIYGGKNAITPNIDALAKESLVFNRAYLSEAMCQPCRAELYSGLYPLSNGCAWNHSASHNDLKTMPQRLGEYGYRVGLAGKVHVKPAASFPFEYVPGFDKSCVRNPTQKHSLTGVNEFMLDGNTPFCLIVALVEPHVPWVMGDPTQYKPAKLKLPPNIADTKRTREDFASYLAEITYMDGQVGEILKALEDSGKADNTLVLFTSEQGAQFPGCKWTNWDTGVHTALVARWPQKIPAGKRTEAIVQYTDVLPTLLDVAGRPQQEPDVLDGKSFLSVLLGESDTHRQFAFGCHNNIPEGPAYPVRTVTNGEFRYIVNLRSDEIYIEKHVMGAKGKDGGLNNPYWGTWVFEAWQNEEIYRLVKRFTNRPPEELYHTKSDPYEMTNLIDHPKHQKIKAELKQELEAWLESQGDPGADQDTHAAHQAAKKGRHLYGPQK